MPDRTRQATVLDRSLRGIAQGFTSVIFSVGQQTRLVFEFLSSHEKNICTCMTSPEPLETVLSLGTSAMYSDELPLRSILWSPFSRSSKLDQPSLQSPNGAVTASLTLKPLQRELWSIHCPEKHLSGFVYKAALD
jgi:hypothetical protein